MLKELVIKCDCKYDDGCNQSLVISPIGSIAIYEGYNFIAGIHLPNEDIDKVIKKLKEIKTRNKNMEEEVEKRFGILRMRK